MVEWVPVIFILYFGAPNWVVHGAVYGLGYETYVECKKKTLEPRFVEPVRMYYEMPKTERVKTDCIARNIWSKRFV